jgi:uncharacterized integral membrane protein
MTSPYKRRKPMILRNLWIYRRLIPLAFVLGLVLWFVLINRDPVTVWFPFRMGQISSTSGVVILLGAGAGSIVTALAMTGYKALKRHRERVADDDRGHEAGDRPPTDYAAKTGEGFSGAHWSAR